jgi:uncharacterized protein YcaQ
VARVDLRRDRKTACLRVVATHVEPGADRPAVLDALGPELDLLAGWLGLERVTWAAGGPPDTP